MTDSAGPATSERLAFVALVALGFGPLVAGTPFANPDVPRHLELLQVAWALLSDPDGAAGAVYVLQDQPIPTLVWYALMSPSIALPADLAERALVATHLVALPLATRWAVQRLAPDAGPVAWLALPLVWGLPLAFGLLNFLHGVAVCALALALATTVTDRPGRIAAGSLVGGSLLLGVHPLMYDLTVMLVAGILAWRLAVEADRAAALRRGVAVLVGLAPTLAWTAWFLATRPAGAPPLWASDTGQRLAWLATGDILLTYGPLELAPAGLAVALWLGLLGRAVVQRVGSAPAARDGLLVAASLAAAFYLTVPDEVAGGTLVARRSQVLVWLPLLLWAGSHPATPVVRRLTGAVVAAIVALQVAGHALAQRGLARDLGEVLAVSAAIQPGQTVLFLSASPTGVADDGSPRPGRVAPLAAAGAMIANRTGAVDLANWPAAHDLFPIVYRTADAELRHLGLTPVEAERAPPPVDLAAVRDQVDHLVLFGVTAHNEHDPDVRFVVDQLAGWTLVETSEPRGLARRYAPR